MDGLNFFEAFAYMMATGVASGLLFTFFKGETWKSCWANIRLGLIGSSIGILIALNLPIVPSNRGQVMIAFATLVPFYVLIGNWMISKGTTPIAKAISDYHEAPEDLEKQDREHDNQPHRPAA